MSRKLDARAATFSPSLGAAAGVAGAAAAAAPLPPQENKPRSSASSAAGAGTQGSRRKSNQGRGRPSPSTRRANGSKAIAPGRNGGGQDGGGGSTSTSTSSGNGSSRSIEGSSRQEGGGRGSTGKGWGKGGNNTKGGNANHLLNFQFQPLSSAAHQGENGGGRARRGSGGGGSGRSKGGGIWGGGSARGPMSKEQFLQANFHFLLHKPTSAKGDPSSSSPVLQEAFFDPDVLVDWDTVDTVRLFRKVCKRKKALSPVGNKASAHPGNAQKMAAPNDATTHWSRQTSSGEPNDAPIEPSTVASENGSPAPGFEGLTVLPVAEEISWGSGTTRRGVAGAWTAREASTGKQKGESIAKEEILTAAPKVKGTGDGGCVPDGGVRAEDEEEEGGEGDWRCSICLGVPIAPRVTKCGHGPFCLVCILRHLKGEGSARCPLCFDKMYRDQLRRVSCEYVRPYIPGGKASLLLLQRERISLVPARASVCGYVGGEVGERKEVDAPLRSKGGTLDGSRVLIPGEGVESSGRTDDEDLLAGVCPKEGDESERFSRLVRANPSTIRDVATAEQFSLLSFRHESIKSGETEWVPYVSQAQALVNAQLEQFSALPPFPAANISSGYNPKTRPVAGTGGVREGSLPGLSYLGPDGEQKDDGASTHAGVEREDGSRGGSNGGGGNKDAPCVVVAEGVAAAEPGTKANTNTNSSRSNAEDAHHDVAVVLDSSTTTAAAGAAVSADTGSGGGGGPFRFFQSSDGQKAFLHPLDMRQLLDDVEKGLPLPHNIDAQVLEVETVKLTPELRRRLPFLGHLPIYCDVSFLEVDMEGLVSEATKQKFREEIKKRERKRRSRAAQEARAAKKEAQLEQDRTDRIAAMRTFTVDLQGPTPGGAESPQPPPATSSSAASASANQAGTASSDHGGTRTENGLPGAAAAAAAAAADPAGFRDDSTSGAPPSSGAGLADGATGGTANGAARSSGSSGTGTDGQGGTWSFARVTAMNGHFPTLNPSAAKAGGAASTITSNSNQAAGAWGSTATTTVESTAAYGGGSGGGAGAWGAPASDPSTGADAVGEGRTLGERVGGAMQSSGREGAGNPTGTGKKKGRKGKAVSLFSNAGVRGGSR